MFRGEATLEDYRIMDMIDSTVIPPKDSKRYKFNKWFVDNVNVCHGTFYDSVIEKPENKLYNLLYKYWLWPYNQTDCICCNTVRGLIYGGILGFILGKLL